MSLAQSIWAIMWDFAAHVEGPFEIDEFADQVVARLGLSRDEAIHRASFLLGELDRLPQDKQFFLREGNAAVPQPSYTDCRVRGVSAEEAYPFED